jgi:hypothetical protein
MKILVPVEIRIDDSDYCGSRIQTEHGEWFLFPCSFFRGGDDPAEYHCTAYDKKIETKKCKAWGNDKDWNGYTRQTVRCKECLKAEVK